MVSSPTLNDDDLPHPRDDDSVDSSDESGDGIADSDGHAQETSKEEEVIGKLETKAVLRQKLIMMVVLLCSAIGVATAVYFYVAGSEEEQFHNKFDDDSLKVLEAIGTSFDRTLGALDSVSTTLVTYAKVANQSWPFVTMPDFAVRMSKILPLSDALSINILPILTPNDRAEWESYTIDNDYWVDESMSFQETWEGYYGPVLYKGGQYGTVHSLSGDIEANVSRLMLPSWQKFPSVGNSTYTYNYDWLQSRTAKPYATCVESGQVVVTVPSMNPMTGNITQEEEAKRVSKLLRDYIPPTEDPMEPMSSICFPITEIDENVTKNGDQYNAAAKVLGVIRAPVFWRSTFRNILPQGSDGIHLVVSNPCTDAFTYEINGPNVKHLGYGDKHEKEYTGLGKSSTLHDLKRYAQRSILYTGVPFNEGFCPFTLYVYPSNRMESTFTTNNRVIFTLATLGIFAFASLVFYLYDSQVERRQQTVMRTAVRSLAIVSSLFPSDVRDRLYPTEDKENTKNSHEAFLTNKLNGKINAFGRDRKIATASMFDSAPIAELYPETTVLFADIAGFTAWSSVRQPTQVFQLLESVYSAFDEIAKRRGVFKVETVGDSYVATVGLPTPRKHHAVVMVRFANDCRVKMNELALELDKILGPGTSDLSMRFGLNSGPTTAGVLRGEKSRFQLFGDTVNTAARMESNGERNRIQISQKTADLVILAGKGHWLIPREDKVDCKGKGLMTTFWCDLNSRAPSGSAKSNSIASDDAQEEVKPELMPDAAETKLNRLVDWNFDMILGLVKGIAADNTTMGIQLTTVKNCPDTSGQGVMAPLAEVSEVLAFRQLSRKKSLQNEPIHIVPTVELQLRDFITVIAKMYRNNPFHNFDHGSHVTMSTKKLLDRIAERERESELEEDATCTLRYVNPIASDPLTRFAIVFAALIHDVDHPGVSNAQLVQEGSVLSNVYNGKSVAEQNSVDLVWNLLMEPRFADLREIIFPTKADQQQFRQIVVNLVMATDLFDMDLKSLRDSRWEKSFGPDKQFDANNMTEEESNRRTTIIMELLLQASDVSHTMQHFTVYKKWNQNLLTEVYEAYTSGRTPTNPLEGWYEGELWFFDHYVIPLAQKLRECGVFGVSCDEFLDYAKDNRAEWEMKGRDIVSEFAQVLESLPKRRPSVGYGALLCMMDDDMF